MSRIMKNNGYRMVLTRRFVYAIHVRLCVGNITAFLVELILINSHSCVSDDVRIVHVLSVNRKTAHTIIIVFFTVIMRNT